MLKRTFSANFGHLDEIREFVGEEARVAGFDDRAVYAVQLAADEAASNIIEHAYAGLPNRSFECACEFRNDSLTITFFDHGQSFDFSSVEKPNVTADLSERKIGGLGIYLMHKLMDEVDYRVTASGNVLTLVKRKE